MTGRGASLATLPIDDEARARLEGFLGILDQWAPRVNLTAARTDNERIELLIRPALAASRLILPGHLIDVGSGNGSPGLVIALVRPDVRVTLLEPRLRRWAFLRDAARASNAQVTVLRRRHEHYDGELADTLTARALRLGADDARRLLRQGGRWILFHAPDEIPPGFARSVDGAAGGPVYAIDRVAR